MSQDVSGTERGFLEQMSLSRLSLWGTLRAVGRGLREAVAPCSSAASAPSAPSSYAGLEGAKPRAEGTGDVGGQAHSSHGATAGPRSGRH